MAGPNPVPQLYKTVVNDVINNVRESFLDDGRDEQVLQELRQLWESKLHQSKAVEGMTQENQAILEQHFAQVQQQQQQREMVKAQQKTLQRSQGVVRSQPQQSTSQPTQNLPVYTQLGNTLDMSGAAAQAAIALPQGLYSQQMGAVNSGNIAVQQQPGQRHVAMPAGEQVRPQYITIQAPPGMDITQLQQQIQLQQQQQQQLQLRRQQGIQGQQQIQLPQGIMLPLQTQDGQQAQISGNGILQMDGAQDTSSDDDDANDSDDDDANDDNDNEENQDDGQEEEPLNSADDVSDDDAAELFDTDNVVVCQYDKINRTRNKWKFMLKDGIMNLNGKDYVFQKATGDAEW